jgi:hypothetical protein
VRRGTAAALAKSSPTPGAALLSPVAFASLAVILTNDLWLKRQHPGLLSGKLSDLGLCVFLPLFVAAVIEWAVLLLGSRVRVTALPCALAALYFVAIKVWPSATHAHVAGLSLLVPRWHFRAVTDPPDLVCLPALALAWWTLRRASGFRSDVAPARAAPTSRPALPTPPGRK